MTLPSRTRMEPTGPPVTNVSTTLHPAAVGRAGLPPEEWRFRPPVPPECKHLTCSTSSVSSSPSRNIGIWVLTGGATSVTRLGIDAGTESMSARQPDPDCGTVATVTPGAAAEVAAVQALPPRADWLAVEVESGTAPVFILMPAPRRNPVFGQSTCRRPRHRTTATKRAPRRTRAPCLRPSGGGAGRSTPRVQLQV